MSPLCVATSETNPAASRALDRGARIFVCEPVCGLTAYLLFIGGPSRCVL